MKKILICIALCLPLTVWAQSELTPEQQLAKARQEAEAAKQAVKEAKKAAKAARKAKEQKSKDAEIQRQIEEAQKEAARYKAEAERIKAEAAATDKAQEEQQKAKAERQKAAAERAKTEEAARKAEAKAQPELVPQVAKEQPQAPVQGIVSNGWTVPEATSQSASNNTNVVKGKSSNEKKDPKYLRGAVPQNEKGEVVFTLDLNVPGKTAQQIYDRSNEWLKSVVTGDDQVVFPDGNIRSRIAITNAQEHETIATISEWLVFQKNIISVDRTQCNYVLQTKSTDGHFLMTISKIRYNYEEGRPGEMKISAEKWITDEEAISKKNTLRAGSAKFRRATIDRKDVLFKEITALLK